MQVSKTAQRDATLQLERDGGALFADYGGQIQPVAKDTSYEQSLVIAVDLVCLKDGVGYFHNGF